VSLLNDLSSEVTIRTLPLFLANVLDVRTGLIGLIEGIAESTATFGVAVGEQLHRALEIGEEHGDLLALALEGGLGGEDLLGQVLGGIAVRRTRRCARSAGNGMSAGVAELGRG